MTFEEWAKPILGDNPNWRESGDGELARQAYAAGRDSDTALLRQALGQLECNTENMSKGMSKSIQRLCARENKEAITALCERLGEKI